MLKCQRCGNTERFSQHFTGEYEIDRNEELVQELDSTYEFDGDIRCLRCGSDKVVEAIDEEAYQRWYDTIEAEATGN